MVRRLLVLAMLALAAGVLAPASLAVSPNIVVSQVYGGGGNTDAQYTHDFIELFNRGTTAVDVGGWSLQYASATGTGNFGATAAMITELGSNTIPPGGYLLVREAQGLGGTTELPPPFVTDATPIAMAAGAGKVALVNTQTPLGCNGGSTPCSAAALAQIVDLVGYGGANFFEGAGPTAATSNTTAALRDDHGCIDTDNNAADFSIAAPAPRNFSTDPAPCGDAAPAVSQSSPAGSESGVPVGANISITFSEPVNVAGTWFTISCTSSGAHTAAVTGGPTTFTLDPDTDFVASETCTVRVVATQVTDQDADDPPDAMAANHDFSFTTEAPPTRIHEIQGASHISPKSGQLVQGVLGIVVARSANGFWMQDPSPDADPETSEGLFVFTGGPPAAALGDVVRVAGTVVEFRPGGAATTNLTTTEISNPGRSIVVVSSDNALPAATVIGAGGRVPPNQVIDDDATGNVETSGSFDAATDGIDFYESLEGMRVALKETLAVGPTNDFGEIPVVGDDGANAALRTPRGGVIARPTDFNPERVHLDDALVVPASMPTVNVGDSLGTVAGVLDYSFGNFKLLVDLVPTVTSGGLARETGAAAQPGRLTVATFNVENLDPSDPDAKFDELAELIVDHLQAPDLISLEEVQDNNGPTNDSVVAAGATYAELVDAIEDAGGPTYEFRQIDPVDDQDGGEPGGNIRVGFLFRVDRGLAFVDRPGGTSTAATTVLPGPQLSFSPGRIDPTNAAFAASRKPLAGEFTYRGARLFVVANHFNSKGGDDPLFGRFQPPNRVTEAQRHQQAQIVNDFVDAILAEDADANVLVLGDLNDFDFSETLTILRGSVLTNLYSLLPQNERYSYDFEGNSQALDHVLASAGLIAKSPALDVVHVNAEFAQQASDHDPLLAAFCADATAPTLTVTATPNRLWPPNHGYVRVEVARVATDDADPSPAISFVSATSSEPDNAPGGADGNTVDDVVKIDDDTFDLRAERDEGGTGRTYTLTYRAEDDCSNAATASATVRVPITIGG